MSVQVRDPIHGSITLHDGEVSVVDHPLFQRLRNIKQLGFSEMAFPGATHSRYSHSLGAMALASDCFDAALDGPSSCLSADARRRFRDALRLAACLHDVGHPPMSHCAEVALPDLRDLSVSCYRSDVLAERAACGNTRACHEDLAVKIITESDLSEVLRRRFPHLGPVHVAALVSNDVEVPDDFFTDGGLDYRPILSQIVSGEIDADRMDYLRRDSHYAGVSYGSFDARWLITNLTSHAGEDGRVHLAVTNRALYTVDDFLIARYHMFLMVYFHHRSVAYEEMLRRYFQSEGEGEGAYRLPAVADAYVGIDDHHLQAHLRASGNPWARRIVDRRAIRLLVERHGAAADEVTAMARRLDEAGIPNYPVLSSGVLSKYVQGGRSRSPIYVVDPSPSLPQPPRRLEEATDLFERYGERRSIARLYVDRENLDRGREVLVSAPCHPPHEMAGPGGVPQAMRGMSPSDP